MYGIVQILPKHYSHDKITKLAEETLHAYSESEVDIKIVIDNNVSYTLRQLKLGYEKIKKPYQTIDENWKENLIDQVQEITGVENIILDIKILLTLAVVWS